MSTDLLPGSTRPLAALVLSAWSAAAQVTTDGPRYLPPDGNEVTASHANDFRDLPDRYARDRDTFTGQFPSRIEEKRIAAVEHFYRAWQEVLREMDFDSMNRSGQVDYILFRRRLERDQEQFAEEATLLREAAVLVPFAGEITALEYQRRALDAFDLQELAPALEALAKRIDGQRRELAGRVADARKEDSESEARQHTEKLFRTAEEAARELQGTVENWFGFYRGYDPLFTWWIAAPSKKLAAALAAYADLFKPEPGPERSPEEGSPPGEEGGINAEKHRAPVGPEHLADLLREEMIPYSAAELIALARRELDWCVAEQRKVAAELGFGQDLAGALDHVKQRHVPPGEQPAAIRRLALEAIAYLEANELVSIPALAKDSWRIGMMSPDRQRYNPFFTGGSTISVSYPHDEMEHADKLMSMRGNNPHFSAATVHHELIPGHHLQDFMTSRYNTHRSGYNTVFWTEGWALYWEMLLWDLGFPKTPEDRMGFLFWRMHRCARIIFSLGYHQGEFTPQQCVDLLVEVVGHERTHAEGEVRRSFAPGTPVLYQCAYMLGGMQFYVLQRELVASGKMSPREFHDRVLRGNRIPVEMVRAELSEFPLTRDYTSHWKFAEQFRH